MTSFDLISMAIRNLWKRKLRTFLTVLGVVIGTAAIIVMVSLGIGMNESFEAQLSQRGSLKVITVNSSGGGNYGRYGGMSIMGGSSNQKGNKNVSLDDKAINTFKNIKGVEAVTPISDGYFRFVVDKYVGQLQVRGIDPATMEAFGYNVDKGRLLMEGDDLDIVFSSEASSNLYNPKLNWRVRYNNPVQIDFMNEKIQMTYDHSYGEKRETIPNMQNNEKIIKPAKIYKIKTAGILSPGNGMDSYYSYMPIAQVQKLKKEQTRFEKEKYGGGSSNDSSQTGYDSASVKCQNMEDVQVIQDIIKEMGFQAYSLTDDLKAMQETSKSMQALLGAIGAVSLFVAAIGITNTMVMSIYERTREIGVMKVIGAAIKDIKRLFLIEAALIGFLGGLFGIGISLIISMVINSSGVQLLGMMSYGNEATKISSVPIWLCFSALIFSALVGIVSGYFPARRAMKLSAISAIRTE